MSITPIVQNDDKGFTLIELIVVVGVIAGFALMMAPGLARTRPNVKTAQCLNTIKQWGTALQLYAQNNADGLPRDGFGANGLYPSSGVGGTPSDSHAWFNLLPQLIGDKKLGDYASQPGGNPMAKFPFPGGQGKVWHCSGAYMTSADVALVSGGGAGGFFSYGMNIDLKKQDASSNMAYPGMPPLTSFRKPAATVFLFDALFNPRTEAPGPSSTFNSVNPGGRFRSFYGRHGNGGSIVFLDGHATIFSASYVGNASSSEPNLPDIIWNAPARP